MYCEICDCTFTRMTDKMWERHLLTKRHTNNVNKSTNIIENPDANADENEQVVIYFGGSDRLDSYGLSYDDRNAWRYDGPGFR